MSLVETVHTVPSLASPVRDKICDYSAYSPFGLVPSPTDFLNWDAGSPFFHQTDIKAEPVSVFEACSPHSLHSPSPSPSASPQSPSAAAENELIGIRGLSEFTDSASCKARSNPSRSHPYARSLGYRSVPKEQSILHSVLCSKTSRAKPEYGSPNTGLGAEISLDLPSQSPLGVGELGSGSSNSDFMGDLFRLVWSSVESDSHQISQRLNIPRNPYEWSRTDVIKWVSHVQEEQKLDPVLLLTSFSMTGKELLAMNEQEFRARYPQGGSILYAKLEILRMYWEKESSEPAEIPLVDIEDTEPCGPEDPFALESPDSYLPLPVASPTMSSCYLSPQSDFSAHSPSTVSSAPTPSPSYFGEMRDDDDEDEESGQGGSHIHLWQFIKELLLQPETYGSAIRWVSRDEGIFKIEDSVRVARLWGKRKNRPAMNYDKLSRSLRQYYKKGVMKKTERSQRLVYQFCDPYFK